MTKTSALANVSLFSELSAPELQCLADLFEERRFSDAEKIIQEGAPSQSLFVIVSGFAHVTRQWEGSESIFLCTLSEGALLGEAALFPQLKRTASITASGAVNALEISRNRFVDFTLRYPAAGNRILMRMLLDVFTKLQNTTFELKTQRSQGLTQGAVDRLFS